MKFKQNIIVVVSAAVALLLIPYATDFFSTELREASAIIAEAILRIANLPVERQHTILRLAGMSFDIIPACDGSTTITVLFVTALFLVVGNEKLDLFRKVACAVLAVPVALICNGIRLALLVYCSHVRGFIISKGFLHDSIGVLGFLIALTIIFLIVEVMSTGAQSEQRQTQLRRELFVTSIVFACFALAPFFAACVRDWIGTDYNRNDMFGFIFFAFGLGCYLYCWRCAENDRSAEKTGVALFSTVLFFAAAFQIIAQNNYLLGIAFVVMLFALALMEKGWRFALSTIPAIFIVFLGYSKISETINQVLGTQGFLIPFALKVVAAILASALQFLLIGRFERYLSKNESSSTDAASAASLLRYYSAMAVVALISVFFSIRGYAIVKSPEAYTYDLNYAMGEWRGLDVKDEKAENYYSKRELIVRIYAKEGAGVGLMLVPSNADSKTIHTPEYCQQAQGWRVNQSAPIKFVNGGGRTICARKLLMSNSDGIDRVFVYWFDDGVNSTGNYLEFMLENSIQRLFGEKKNWILYIVWFDNSDREEVLNDFLARMVQATFKKVSPKKSDGG